jgi:hypothetical protein
MKSSDIFAQNIKLNIDYGAYCNIVKVSVGACIGYDGYFERVVCGFTHRQRDTINGHRPLYLL